MKERKLPSLISSLQRRWQEFVLDWQQRADGYSHLRWDDRGSEPDHTPRGSKEWREWERRYGYRRD